MASRCINNSSCKSPAMQVACGVQQRQPQGGVPGDDLLAMVHAAGQGRSTHSHSSLHEVEKG